MRVRASLCLAVLLAAGCSREPGLFIEANARAHVGVLAGTIGSRPVGSPANARAREYITDQLRQIGFTVRVQEIDARRHERGVTARVANIIGVLPGVRSEAVALVSHYDSRPYSPGATDAALGVGVALEAARILASRTDRHWSLFVLFTDGEEAGLMGAAGLVTDREITDRLHAYLNLESIGSSGPAVLFESGPGNGWIVAPWARSAPHPRGHSYATEIYRLLPNDTDFSIFRTRGIPGLNFAPAGDSYAYHTARDTPERLARETIRTTGENVVAILGALQAVDITQRSAREVTFFDIGSTAALSYGTGVQWVLSSMALLLGSVAWVRVSAHAVRQNGALRWLLTFVWAWAGAFLASGAMVAATWLLRAAREVYHPWYARPGRLFVLLIIVAATVAWSMARLGQWLPGPVHPVRHPSLAWSVALPGWILVAGLVTWFVPAAAYLWGLPLLAAGGLLAWVPVRNPVWIRLSSLVVLGVAGTLWLHETHDVLRFAVAALGRLALVTPVTVYAGLLSAAGLMIVPPLVSSLAAERAIVRPWLITAVLLMAMAGAWAAAYLAPAYTPDQPLRRHVRALQDGSGPSAVWEIASVEPGLDLTEGAPGGWMPVAGLPAATPVWDRWTFPFVFRAEGPDLGPAPASIAAFSVTPLPDGLALAISVVPREPGLTMNFVLPEGIVPGRSSLPGRSRHGRWTAAFAAPPPEGIQWEASFRGVTADQLRETRIAVTAAGFPGAPGWQRLPEWLPQERAVWTASATWIMPAASGPAIAPVPPLR